jgi:hypothetical protein
MAHPDSGRITPKAAVRAHTQDISELAGAAPPQKDLIAIKELRAFGRPSNGLKSGTVTRPSINDDIRNLSRPQGHSVPEFSYARTRSKANTLLLLSFGKRPNTGGNQLSGATGSLHRILRKRLISEVHCPPTAELNEHLVAYLVPKMHCAHALKVDHALTIHG